MRRSLLLLLISAGPLLLNAQVDFKAKNFPGKKQEFAAILKVFKEGEKLFTQAEKGNDSLYAPAYEKLHEAHLFNKQSIECNRHQLTCLVRMGRFTETLEHYQILEKIDPAFSPNWLPGYAEVLRMSGQYERTAAVYDRYFKAGGTENALWEGIPINARSRSEEINTYLELARKPIVREKSFMLLSALRIPEQTCITVDPFTEDLVYTVFEDNYFRLVRLTRKSDYSVKVPLSGPLTRVPNITYISLHSAGNKLLLSDGNDLYLLSRRGTMLDSVTFLPAAVNSAARENAAVFYGDDIVFTSDREETLKTYIYKPKTGEVTLFNPGTEGRVCSYDPAAQRWVYARSGKGSIGGSDIFFMDNGVERNAGIHINTFGDDTWSVYTSTGAFYALHGDSLLRFVRRRETPYKPVYVTAAHLMSFTDKVFYSSVAVGARENDNESFVLTGEVTGGRAREIPHKIWVFDPETGNPPAFLYTDSLEGTFRAVVPKSGKVQIWVNAKGYMPFTTIVDAEAVYTGTEHIAMNLEPVRENASLVLPYTSGLRELSAEKARRSAELMRLSDWLRLNNKTRIQIGVHTDNLNMTPNAIRNGEEKARILYEFLRDQDVERRRLDWIFEGPERPLYPNNTAQNRILNRRTEIIVTQK